MLDFTSIREDAFSAVRLHMLKGEYVTADAWQDIYRKLLTTTDPISEVPSFRNLTEVNVVMSRVVARLARDLYGKKKQRRRLPKYVEEIDIRLAWGRFDVIRLGRNMVLSTTLQDPQYYLGSSSEEFNRSLYLFWGSHYASTW